MTTIGSQLRAAREGKGIIAAEAAKRLHMRAMFVEALEREDWTTVGEPVYVRGFIRNYARFLGLDAQEFVDAFNESVAPVAVDPVIDGPPDFARSPRRFRYPWLLGAMSLIAVLLVVRVVWTMANPGAVGHDELHPAPAQAMSNSASSATAVDHKSTASVVAKQGVNLRLQLTQSCWLSIAVDGKQVVYQTLPAGTIKEFHGVRQIALRAGNAGGVVATIDGQDLGTLGTPGQVQDRVFAVKAPPIGQPGLHE